MKLIAEDNQLTIELEGLEILASLRHKIVIPKDKITSLVWQPLFSTRERELRLGGTGLPGVLYAGNWRGGNDWYFLYIKKPKGYPLAGNLAAENILTLELTDYKYREIWLTCQPDIGESLMAWWRGQ